MLIEVFSTVSGAVKALARAAMASFRFTAVLLPVALGGCAQSGTFGHAVNNAKLVAVTSPIVGAQARLLPATVSHTNAAPTIHFCVTDAGYCPLAAATAPGRNCLCQAGTLVYGGTTGIPPQTYVPDDQ